jgi:hypothetical protein
MFILLFAMKHATIATKQRDLATASATKMQITIAFVTFVQIQ